MSDDSLRNLCEYYSVKQIKSAKRKLQENSAIKKYMRDRGIRRIDELFWTRKPLKYLGIELGTGQKPRYPLDKVVELLILNPRSADGDPKGLRLSVHRAAFRKRFPKIDAELSTSSLKRLGARANTASAHAWTATPYIKEAKSALQELQARIGLSWEIAAQVLRKGLAAYRGGHRPGMSAHGWALARLTSFVMKGCTHYLPDHILAEKAITRSSKLSKFWDSLPCLCRKRAQCSAPGRMTRANAIEDGRVAAA